MELKGDYLSEKNTIFQASIVHKLIKLNTHTQDMHLIVAPDSDV